MNEFKINMFGVNILTKYSNQVCLKIIRNKHYGPPQPYVHGNPINIPKSTPRKFSRKHWAPQFARERYLKFSYNKIINFQEKNKAREQMTPAEIRNELKDNGIYPEYPWKEKDVYLASSSQAFEQYIPPEGDGKAAFLSIAGAKDKMALLTNKGKSMLATRKFASFDEEFQVQQFPAEAKEIFINMHNALCNKDEDLLHKCCTEKLFPLITHNTKLKSIRWRYVQDLEPPRVVHCRYSHLMEDTNLFGQVTVRFHSQQTLAIYDRFGRLIHGSDIVARDCLEYIVFEKHISNIYGLWRVHHKIIPEWMEMSPNALMTYKVKEEVKENNSIEIKNVDSQESEDSKVN